MSIPSHVSPSPSASPSNPLTPNTDPPISSPVDRHQELRAVSHHEASHAVVALRLGVHVDHVTIFPKGGTVGGTAFAPAGQIVVTSKLPVREQKDYARRRGIVDICGRIGEELATGAWDTQGARGDLADLDQCLRELESSPTSRLAIRHDLEQEARRLVDANWASIRAVATALVHEETLSGARVAEIASIRSERSVCPPTGR